MYELKKPKRRSFNRIELAGEATAFKSVASPALLRKPLMKNYSKRFPTVASYQIHVLGVSLFETSHRKFLFAKK